MDLFRDTILTEVQHPSKYKDRAAASFAVGKRLTSHRLGVRMPGGSSPRKEDGPVLDDGKSIDGTYLFDSLRLRT